LANRADEDDPGPRELPRAELSEPRLCRFEISPAHRSSAPGEIRTRVARVKSPPLWTSELRGLRERSQRRSVAEMATRGEHHRCACVVARGDRQVVSFRAAWLDDRLHAGVERQAGAVVEGEERVA